MATRRSILTSSMEPLTNSGDPLRELFEACKTGDIARVRKLVTTQTVNARDTAGRKSTPLHFAAGNYSYLFLFSITVNILQSFSSKINYLFRLWSQRCG